ncbi:cytochrome P450 [Thozetella sp. PMI_491]|nr:cytochrome P450 [Thozetella sp. PMI_491]
MVLLYTPLQELYSPLNSDELFELLSVYRAAVSRAVSSIESAVKTDWHHDSRPSHTSLVLTAFVFIIIVRIAWGPPFPYGSPKLLPGSYPIFCALRFFSHRGDFLQDGCHKSETEHFSFYCGKRRVVGLSSLDGRKTFFESKDLSLWSKGRKGTNSNVEDDYYRREATLLHSLPGSQRVDILNKHIPVLIGDTSQALRQIVTRSNTGNLLDPFDDICRIAYQFLVRAAGPAEIAESPEVQARILDCLLRVEEAKSAAYIIFPWLPTPARLKQVIACAKIYMILNGVARNRSGRQKQDDALQFLLDRGDNKFQIVASTFATFFATHLNLGIMTSWTLCYIAADRYWYNQVQHEVDTALAKFRTSKDQAPAAILAGLTAEQWELEFPLIDLCLKDCLRIQNRSCAFRKNVGWSDVKIGKSGEFIPRDVYALHVDAIHHNPGIYKNPSKWDPGRYLPGRCEDKKVQLGYLGWGVGGHPCLGKRLAKLEVSIIVALFFAMFEFHLCDTQGNPISDTPPVDRSRISPCKPDIPMRLKYKLRHRQE